MREKKSERIHRKRRKREKTRGKKRKRKTSSIPPPKSGALAALCTSRQMIYSGSAYMRISAIFERTCNTRSIFSYIFSFFSLPFMTFPYPSPDCLSLFKICRKMQEKARVRKRDGEYCENLGRWLAAFFPSFSRFSAAFRYLLNFPVLKIPLHLVAGEIFAVLV